MKYRSVGKSGLKISEVALGSWVTDLKGTAAEDVAKETVKLAYDSGVNFFDCADAYSGGAAERFLGEVLKQYPRKELVISSKVYFPTGEGVNDRGLSRKHIFESIDQTLKNMQTDYLDMYLIHWPLPNPEYKDWKELDKETWRAMEDLYEEGRVKSIGLSNFLPHHIENLLEDCRVRPMADQLEFHPGYSQEAAVRYCQERNILVQAWSPIGRKRVLEEPLIKTMAKTYEVSEAQICLRYAVQRGVVPLPKSSSPERMKQNQDVFSFTLSEEDMYRLETMPQCGWSGEHPDRVRVPAEQAG